MDLNYKTNLIFPIPIHQFDVNGFSKIKDELIDYVYDCKKKDPKGVSLSNRGGWQSEGLGCASVPWKAVVASGQWA